MSCVKYHLIDLPGVDIVRDVLYPGLTVVTPQDNRNSNTVSEVTSEKHQEQKHLTVSLSAWDVEAK